MGTRFGASGLIAAALLAVAGCAFTGTSGPGKPEYTPISSDTRLMWGDDGELQNLAPGPDSATLVGIGTEPANPKIVANRAPIPEGSHQTGDSDEFG